MQLREQASNGTASREYGGMTGIATGVLPASDSATRGSTRKITLAAHHIELSPTGIRTTVDTHREVSDKESIGEKMVPHAFDHPFGSRA